MKMRSKRKLSIIVTLYNGEDYIERCLKSIENAAYNNENLIEVVVINDGSIDSSEKIVEDFKKNSSLDINLISVENGGVAQARNLGIRVAIGEYLWFVDCDDSITNESIIKILKNFKTNRDIYIYKYKMVTQDGEYVRESKTFDYVKNIENYTGIYKDMNASKFKQILFFEPGPVLYVLKKKIFIENNIIYPLGRIYEDLGTTPRLLVSADTIEYTNEIIYNYHQTNNSIMRGTKIEKKRDIISILMSLKEYFVERNIYKIYKDELEYLTIKHSHYIYESIFLENSKHDVLKDITKFINEEYPRWYNNKYFKKEQFKTRLLYRLELSNKYNILKLIKGIKKIVR